MIFLLLLLFSEVSEWPEGLFIPIKLLLLLGLLKSEFVLGSSLIFFLYLSSYCLNINNFFKISLLPMQDKRDFLLS